MLRTSLLTLALTLTLPAFAHATFGGDEDNSTNATATGGNAKSAATGGNAKSLAGAASDSTATAGADSTSGAASKSTLVDARSTTTTIDAPTIPVFEAQSPRLPGGVSLQSKDIGASLAPRDRAAGARAVFDMCREQYAMTFKEEQLLHSRSSLKGSPAAADALTALDQRRAAFASCMAEQTEAADRFNTAGCNPVKSFLANLPFIGSIASENCARLR